MTGREEVGRGDAVNSGRNETERREGDGDETKWRKSNIKYDLQKGDRG